MRKARFQAAVLVVLVIAAASPGLSVSGATVVLNERPLHLGFAGKPEWQWFAGRAPDALRLDLRFLARTNLHDATLFIRQDDVKQDWLVELNGKRLGKLFLMEADLVHTLPVPAGALKEGTNLLSIVPPKEVDDIVLNEIRIDPRPLAEALSQAALIASVTDADSGLDLPCRLTIADLRGTLAPFFVSSNAPLATRPGVVYTGDGSVRVGLPPGDYTVYASRGFEWSAATQHVHVAAGALARVALQLRREVATPGLVSCDPHVHTYTHSRHGDATIDERMLTLAGEGIDLPIATDHNLHVDYSEAARRTGMNRHFTPITGNEVTTPTGHFNVFPVEPAARAPDFRITHWPTLMTALRGTPGVRVVMLNHPRNVHSGFQPFAATNYNAVTGENLRGAEFTFDAIELLNSSAQQSDYMLVYRDWFALLNYGYRVTGVGSSDGHDVSRYIVGQGRTYLACPDADPARIDVASACSSLLASRALVSMGLLVTLTVNGTFIVGDLATNLGTQLQVTARVLGPSWVSATNVALYANGVRIRDERIDPDTDRVSAASGGVKATVAWTMPRPAHDVHLVAIATGPAVTAPFWAIPKPYQPASPEWSGRVIGSTNPIWLDADGDGRFQAARAYARELVARHRGNLARLLLVLRDFDEAVAAQAAGLCAAENVAMNAPEFGELLADAANHVRRGFAAFLATQK